MLYSAVIADIIAQTDEAQSTNGEARAREHFRGALSELIRNGDYRDEDIPGLLYLEDYLFAAGDSGEVDLADLLGTPYNIMVVKKVYMDPEDIGGKIISEATLDEISRYSYATNLRPSVTGDDIKYYQIGKTVKFIPKDTMDGLTISFFLVLAPFVWLTGVTPTTGKWIDNTDMLVELGYSFLRKAIMLAVSYFKEELVSNE